MDTRDTAAGRSTQSGEEAPDPGPLDATARELAALRERLRAVEAALDLPARPGHPAPPALPALLARVAALERRSGGVPGLVPLLGDPPGANGRPAAPDRWPVWRERGPELLATVLALALCAWLLRPLPGHVAPAPPPVVAATVTVAPPAAVAPARVRAAPPAVPPTPWPPCDHDSDLGCPWNPVQPHDPLAALRRGGRRVLRRRGPGPGPADADPR
jgi:hypothetical protein